MISRPMRQFPERPLEKLVNGSYSELLEDKCIRELFDAIETKDIKLFRMAVSALIYNCFSDEEDKNASS